MDYSKNITHISLCAGYGGIDLGLSRAIPAMRTIAFCEIETYACANLVTKMEAGLLDSAPIWTDLKTFPWSSFSGKVDIISGGFPCQPFSAAGSRGADEDPRHLFPYILRGLTELGLPPIVFLENVEGIISAKLAGTQWTDPPGTSVLQHVLRELERVGYRATAGVFSASEVGAPHQRKRVFILGLRDDMPPGSHLFISSFIKNRRNSKLAYTHDTGNTAPTSHANGNGAESECGRHDQPQLEPVRCNIIDAWPLGRGFPQHPWEPPRITNTNNDSSVANEEVGNTITRGWRQIGIRNNRSVACKSPEEETAGHQFTPPSQHKSTSRCADTNPQSDGTTQSPLGGDAHGDPYRLDYGVMCYSVDSRTDELRLLGNGVVPAVAERAFRILWERLLN